ncbi:hypothetical protein L1987_61023 [Smallanthus sonchifolius]|uniref:Uncharacterized protein n=1 Tax=Smallanthus sonchifolius TaxID=185202 RepID=A0ACB9DA02_9ASTR|nr:hypothetical protein L1987_61023 [Smallanthus sonchifolius]
MPPTTIQLPPSVTTGISSLPTDILHSHILTRLDAPTLASAACASTSLSTAHHHHLWSTICHSTWPSTGSNQITKIISTFSGDGNGYLSFFSQSFPLPIPDPTTAPPPPQLPTSSSPAKELISAVDTHYRNKPILSKMKITETTNNWFRCSPFRIDLLDPKNVVGTQIPLPAGEATCTALMEDVTLSWILIDPINKRSVNLSSVKPVSVHRHWLSGEVQLRFVTILAGDGGAVVQCRIVVNCGGSEDGNMHVREVTMEMEDMDGKYLDGRGSMVILQRVMEGKRGNGVNKEEEGRRRYRRFEEMKSERRERKSRVEWTLDILSLAFGLFIFVALILYFIVKIFHMEKEK